MPSIHEFPDRLPRQLVFILFSLTGLLAGFVASFLFSPRYTSQATLREEFPNKYGVQIQLTVAIAGRFQEMAQHALSTDRIQQAVRSSGLVAPKQQADEFIEDIRVHTIITPMDIPGQLTEPVFFLRYSDHDPRLAQRICQMLTTLIVEESLMSRYQMSESTTEFLQRQIDAAHDREMALERELARYKKKGYRRNADDESRYRSLLHDYKEATQVYADLLKKQGEGILGELMMEEGRYRVVVLAPATLPETPSFPNRSLCAGGGLFGGLVLGFFVRLRR